MRSWHAGPFLLVMFLLGCGYTTRNTAYDAASIFIAPVTNDIKITGEGRLYPDYKTYPRRIENDLTNALVKKFNTNGTLDVVSTSDAGLRLFCSVIGYDKNTLQYSDEDKGEVKDEVKEQQLYLHVQVRLEDNTGKILLQKEVVGETTFYLYGAYAKTEDTAWQDLLTDTSRRVSEVVLDLW